MNLPLLSFRYGACNPEIEQKVLGFQCTMHDYVPPVLAAWFDA